MIRGPEKEQLERLREGDLAGFSWAYAHYHQRVYGYCRKLVGSNLVAEEITEDVFVRLWEKRGAIDPSLPLNGLLLKITKDFVWNYLKKSSREARQQSEYMLAQTTPTTPAIESELILKDYLKIAEAAIEQLPEKRRLVFKLRYKNGMENREIAQQLDISETTVRVHLLKATQFLRNYLKSHPEIPAFLLLHLLKF